MIINDAIMHIYDKETGIGIFSDQSMDLKSDFGLYEYLEKHLRKCMKDNTAYRGSLGNSTLILDYKEEGFFSFSRKVAEEIIELIIKSDIDYSFSLVFIDFVSEEKHYLAVLFFQHKNLYINIIESKNGRSINTIKSFGAVLPETTQRILEYFILELEDKDLIFKEKTRFVDGRDVNIIADILLLCKKQPSVKQTIEKINSIINSVAVKNEMSSIELSGKIKAHILENLDIIDTFDPKEIVKEVFADDEALKEELVVEFDKSDLVPVKHIDKKYLKRIERLHKIKTDTGIELSVPADYLQDRELIEFNYNEDGRISIKLKNIGQIINKK